MNIGSRSPWGTVDHCTPLAPGAWEVSTPSHGGIKLDRKLNARVPEAARRAGGWYEEDCEWSLAVLAIPELARDERALELATSTAKNWHPDEYTAITGIAVETSESFELRRRAFEAETADKYVVYSASRYDDHQVLCRAQHRDPSKPEIKVLVPTERYRNRGQFRYVLTDEDIENSFN